MSRMIYVSIGKDIARFISTTGMEEDKFPFSSINALYSCFACSDFLGNMLR